MLSSSINQMKMVQNKLSDSKESVEYMTPENSGKDTVRDSYGAGGEMGDPPFRKFLPSTCIISISQGQIQDPFLKKRWGGRGGGSS